MKMKTEKVNIQKGMPGMLTSGHKKGSKNQYNPLTGVKTKMRKNGLAITTQKTKISLEVRDTNGNTHEIEVDNQFRDYWPRLTENRLGKIEKTFPDVVDVNIASNGQGGNQLVLPDSEIDRWYNML